MRPLTDRERRTVRLGAIAISVYLALFFGLQFWRGAERRTTEYRKLLAQAREARLEAGVAREKALAAGELMELFRMDPAQLSRTTIVAQATAAIHRAATGGGMTLGPVRETSARSADGEIAAIQLEGMGPVPAILRFIQSLGSLGFPLIADSVLLTPGPQPGHVKLNITIVILDFDQWKPSTRKCDV